MSVKLVNMIALTPYETVVEFFSRVLSDIRVATAALTMIFSIFALIASVGIALRSNIGLAVKILGSLLVMAICFASNNAFVYGIGIFIVATLVTELEFLEKLAAMVWNRKEYWDYLKGKATSKEVEAKIQEEIESENIQAEIGTGSSSAVLPPSTNTVKDAYEFNREVFKALRSPDGPLKITKLEEEVLLHGEGRRYILDGIAHSDKATYIIEIKAGRPRILRDVLYQVNRYIQAYTKYTKERGFSQVLRGIIVLPDGVNEHNGINEIPILKFDPISSRFTNIEIIKHQFPDWDWK